ncbi:MAG: metallophosphoesterase [Pseudomonadota bacterium]
MPSLYVIGDIHGQKAQLDRALGLIEADGGPDARIIFVGDYTDRGPDSRGVLDTLIEGHRAGRNWTLIRGNHDRMFTRFVIRGEVFDPKIKSMKTWLHFRLGGNTTLASYFDLEQFCADNGHTVDALDAIGHDLTLDPLHKALQAAAQDAVPRAHMDFLTGLPLTHTEDGFFFVHAGINPKLPLRLQDEEDLIWIRDGWLDHRGPLPMMVVHGHTARDFPEHAGNRINADGGAAYGNDLVPVVLDGDRVFTLGDQGRTPLTPAG